MPRTRTTCSQRLCLPCGLTALHARLPAFWFAGWRTRSSSARFAQHLPARLRTLGHRMTGTAARGMQPVHQFNPLRTTAFITCGSGPAPTTGSRFLQRRFLYLLPLPHMYAFRCLSGSLAVNRRIGRGAIPPALVPAADSDCYYPANHTRTHATTSSVHRANTDDNCIPDYNTGPTLTPARLPQHSLNDALCCSL